MKTNKKWDFWGKALILTVFVVLTSCSKSPISDNGPVTSPPPSSISLTLNLASTSVAPGDTVKITYDASAGCTVLAKVDGVITPTPGTTGAIKFKALKKTVVDVTAANSVSSVTKTAEIEVVPTPTMLALYNKGKAWHRDSIAIQEHPESNSKWVKAKIVGCANLQQIFIDLNLRFRMVAATGCPYTGAGGDWAFTNEKFYFFGNWATIEFLNDKKLVISYQNQNPDGSKNLVRDTYTAE